MATRQEERKRQALRQLQEVGVLMQAGHYDYGNGYHGRAYLNPHQLFLHPSTIWRLAQDLLDGRRSLSHPPSSFAPFTYVDGELSLRSFYASHLDGRRVLLADDVRNTGATFERCASLVRRAGGTVIGTVEICDRLEAVAELDVPNYALTEYQAPENYPVDRCPMCKAGEPITTF